MQDLLVCLAAVGPAVAQVHQCLQRLHLPSAVPTLQIAVQSRKTKGYRHRHLQHHADQEALADAVAAVNVVAAVQGLGTEAGLQMLVEYWLRAT